VLLNLTAAGLSEWLDPSTAAAADVDSAIKLQAAIIATRLQLQNMLWKEADRVICRKLETSLQELHHTGILLASLLNASRYQ